MGIVLYQLLSGELPFSGSLTAVFMGHLTREPPPLVIPENGCIPPALVDIVQRALEKNPSQRFPSANAFREALDQASIHYLGQSGKTATVAVSEYSSKTHAMAPSSESVSLPQEKAVI